MSCIDAGSIEVRRFEVFTGAGGRRNWTREEEEALVAESYSIGETACGVARRFGLRHSQLFTWRREFKRAAHAAGMTLQVIARGNRCSCRL